MWQKVLSLQPDLPAQPQEKLEDTSLDTQELHTPRLRMHYTKHPIQ